MRPSAGRTVLVIAALTGAACSGPGPRPVERRDRPPVPAAADVAARSRLAVREENRELIPLPEVKAPVPVIAAPDARTTEIPPADDAAPVATLTFDTLMDSVEARFPLVLAALEEVSIAEAGLLSAQGGFDLALKGKADFGVQGFYENETGSLSLEQPTSQWGATVFGGYKVGTGDFPVWDGGLKTRTDGEFRAGVRVPLLAGRTIDQRRVNLWRARIERESAGPSVLAKRLEATRKAALVYWSWVAAGQKLAIAERLLALAEARQAGIEVSVDAGEIRRIALVENRRLIVERESIALRSTRSLEKAAIALSIYWRADDGTPTIPSRAELPTSLPAPRNPNTVIGPEDARLALARRPEITQTYLRLEALGLDALKAENDLLPKLDLSIAGSQDVGDRVSTPDDKGPFEFDAFVEFGVPLQRRGAKGKLAAATAKRRKLERQLQLIQDQVLADVRDVQSNLRITWERLARIRENARLAADLEEAERVELREGTSDLLRVNLREQQTAAAASMLVDAVAEHFRALAEYRATLGLPYAPDSPR